jgi:hypothetical protein
MTLRTRTCHICNLELGRSHDCDAPAMFANHIKMFHPDEAIRLSQIHDQIRALETEFHNIAGRFARESVYYRINKWIIMSHLDLDEDGKPLYWSNGDGWVDRGSAQVFTEVEKDLLNLPINGVWVLKY